MFVSRQRCNPMELDQCYIIFDKLRTRFTFLFSAFHMHETEIFGYFATDRTIIVSRDPVRVCEGVTAWTCWTPKLVRHSHICSLENRNLNTDVVCSLLEVADPSNDRNMYTNILKKSELERESARERLSEIWTLDICANQESGWRKTRVTASGIQAFLFVSDALLTIVITVGGLPVRFWMHSKKASREAIPGYC